MNPVDATATLESISKNIIIASGLAKRYFSLEQILVVGIAQSFIFKFEQIS